MDVTEVSFVIGGGCKFGEDLLNHFDSTGSSGPANIDVLAAGEASQSELEGFASRGLPDDAVTWVDLVGGFERKRIEIAFPA